MQITCRRTLGWASVPAFGRFGKKQGRRRSITPTALPAPDIEIGFRPPVSTSCPGYLRSPVIYFTIGEKF
jgi:hypothetical protein